MALRTLGTVGTTTLTALARGASGNTISDTANLRANIKDDLNVAHPIWPAAYEFGKLYIPNRGVLITLPGDYIAYDSRGWPILLSADTILNGSSWTHNP